MPAAQELMEIAYLGVPLFTGTLQGEKCQGCKCTGNFGTFPELCFFHWPPVSTINIPNVPDLFGAAQMEHDETETV